VSGDIHGFDRGAERLPLRRIVASGAGQARAEDGPGLLPRHRPVFPLSSFKRPARARFRLSADDARHAEPETQLAGDAARHRGQRPRVGARCRCLRGRACSVSGSHTAVDLHLRAVHELVFPARNPGRDGIRPRDIRFFRGGRRRRAELLRRLWPELPDRRLLGRRRRHPTLGVEHPKGLPAALGRGLRRFGRAVPIRGPAGAIRRNRADGDVRPRRGPRSGRCASCWRPSYVAAGTRPTRSLG
jgi:hypothetical protein